jgi:hypothetical protein
MEEVWFRRRRRSTDGMPSRVASCKIDEDGYWVPNGRLTPGQGAVIRQAIEKAMPKAELQPLSGHCWRGNGPVPLGRYRPESAIESGAKYLANLQTWWQSREMATDYQEVEMVNNARAWWVLVRPTRMIALGRWR